MKIRQRLALRFTLVSALLTGAIILFIYVLTSGFVHADFVERLAQQSSLEVLHYATPHASEVVPKESTLLVNPVVSIFSEDGQLLTSHGEYVIPAVWVEDLQRQQMFNAELGEYTTVGRKFTVRGVTYLVFVSDKDLPGQHELDLLIKAMLVGWLVSLVFSYFAGLYFSGNALQPVKRVVEEVNHITKDNLSYRLHLKKDPTQADEIDELVLTFNALLNRIESAFNAQKRFVQNASHELKTPLTAIMAEAELALTKSRSEEEYKRTLEVIVAETERLEHLAKGLLTLARLEEGLYSTEMEDLDVNSLLSHVLATFRLHHPHRSLQLEGEFQNCYVRGNEPLLQIALLNVLDNAVKYSSGNIIMHCSRSVKEIAIAIQDFGMGIPQSEINRVTAPMFRASNATNLPGAGLGLPLVDRIVKVHQGKFEVYSVEGQGTTCYVHMPLMS